MYRLERVHPTEVESIAALVERVIVESVDATPGEKSAFVDNTRLNLRKWVEDPDRSLHVAVRCAGEVVGVVLVRDYWNLCHLFVSPEHQGRGLGRALVEASLSECALRSPRGYVRLNASRNAFGFYKRLGFREVLDAPPAYRGMQLQREFERAV